MSALPADSSPSHPSATPPLPFPRLPWWRRALQEPLLHFVVLGALAFGADHLLFTRQGDPRVIEVPESAYQEARSLVAGGLQREASAADLKILIDRWIDNEVLYREGLALGLDKGDAAIRDRVIFKALSVAQAGLALPPYDESTLRAWFAAHRERYDTPARFDFLEAVVHGDRSEDKLRAFVDSLNGRGSSDTESSLSVFKDRPRGNLEASYGVDFVAALERAKPAGEWQLLPSKAGPRVVRLQEVQPAVQATYESVGDRLLRDWKDETMAQMTTRAVRDMGRQYRIVRQEGGS
jgi:hypothetical protein